MVHTIRNEIETMNLTGLKTQVAHRHPDWLAATMNDLAPTERAIVFRVLPKDTALEVFELMDRDDQAELIEAMSTPEAIEMIEQLDADDRVHVIDELPARVAKRLIGGLTADTAATVQTMLGYEAGTVGRMASPHYVLARTSATAADAMAAVESSALRPEHLNTVFVADDQRRYRGLVRLADLVRAEPAAPITEMVEAADVVVTTTDDAAAAARLLQRRDLDAVPVVDR